jgi:undecaprenyl-diphosphatase
VIEFLKAIDTKLFFFFNGNHTAFMDSLMDWVEYKFTWIPLYVLFLFLAWKKKRERVWLVVLSIFILITLSDQISVHLFKETFQRYRPCNNLLIKDKVQLINGACGGLYGFVSSHAANTFTLITFLSLFFRRASFAVCGYLWAGMVGYSRVYAGVHYPFDIMGGAMLGIFLGMVGWKIYLHFEKKYA